MQNNEIMIKYLLSTLFLLTAFLGQAQLSIQPNGNVPSYMYVKGQVLYVTNDIDLDKNAAGDYEASIYLRDGGQLIQGNTTSSNSGKGYLSVQQKTDPTNAYAYYHWNSPVGNSEDLGSQSGNINFGIRSIYQALGGPDNLSPELGTRAQRALTTSGRNGYINPDMTISTRWTYIKPVPIYEHLDGYIRIRAANDVQPGFGFLMKGVHNGPQPAVDRNGPISNHEQLYEFRGRPNSGTFEIPVLGPDPNGPNGDFQQQLVLAGNPYPSALDLNWLYNDPDNDALDAFYFYDEDRTVGSHFYDDRPSGFATWIPSGGYDISPPGDLTYNPGSYTSASFYIWNAYGSGTSAGATSSRPAATRIAPIGQGIMFAGKPGVNTPTNVKIKNEHRRFVKQGAYSVFHRPAYDSEFSTETSEPEGNPESSSIAVSIADLLSQRMSKLRLYTVFDDALTRDLLLTFSNNATDGYDRGFDGPSPGGVSTDAYFPIMRNGKMEQFVISGTKYAKAKRIPISFKLTKTTDIDMYIAEEENKQWKLVFLYDSQEDTYRLLKPLDENPMAERLTLPAGEYHDRFYITFGIASFSVISIELPTLKEQVNVFQNNPRHNLEIRNPQSHELKSIHLFDVTGKLILSENNLGDRTYHEFSTSHFSDGVYLVKITTNTDMQVDYKVVIMNK